MDAVNFFYYSVGAFAIIAVLLMIAIFYQVFFAIKQIREILDKVNNIRTEAAVAKEKLKLGFLEIVGYIFEKIRGSSDLGGGE